MPRFIAWRTGVNFSSWHIAAAGSNDQRTVCGIDVAALRPVRTSAVNADQAPAAGHCRSCVRGVLEDLRKERTHA